ncbi:MAG: XTP/dITP diphosphatase [Deltaproteobacteria bacterium]|nr:XTP/dITP diphosphatase [Deltaproteobacteria bacterium]TLN02817.1 MAG: XTP/dITP diphosphatase [bacterium]
MKELLVATGNKGKLLEIRQLLAGYVDRVYCLADFPDLPEVIEDGQSFEENARKKAMSAVRATGIPAMADDSGLVVDVLGGRPGVYSARYAGVGASDADNNRKLLRDLAEFSGQERAAFFSCAVALCFPDGTCRTFCGTLNGMLLASPRGTEGFGYDPLFLVPEYGKTLAELDLTIKNSISHRGQAMEELRKFLGVLRG